MNHALANLVYLKNRKWPLVFIQPNANTRESLEEFESLSEPEPQALAWLQKYFQIRPNSLECLHQVI